ncbi:jmjC domain-containing protein C2orf60 [Toxoplasma gondii p89]|uniref:JmjC domain-containing protein C2orf60 n=1 Tax=Toxoplasma gondii p89 TaxID=943119 RepID=A0A086K7K4_TOXGO|nr:jmjC domain-containing protein C2orf60 [Toxoplasma gondii p89]
MGRVFLSTESSEECPCQGTDLRDSNPRSESRSSLPPSLTFSSSSPCPLSSAVSSPTGAQCSPVSPFSNAFSDTEGKNMRQTRQAGEQGTQNREGNTERTRIQEGREERQQERDRGTERGREQERDHDSNVCLLCRSNGVITQWGIERVDSFSSSDTGSSGFWENAFFAVSPQDRRPLLLGTFSDESLGGALRELTADGLVAKMRGQQKQRVSVHVAADRCLNFVQKNFRYEFMEFSDLVQSIRFQINGDDRRMSETPETHRDETPVEKREGGNSRGGEVSTYSCGRASLSTSSQEGALQSDRKFFYFRSLGRRPAKDPSSLSAMSSAIAAAFHLPPGLRLEDANAPASWLSFASSSFPSPSCSSSSSSSESSSSSYSCSSASSSLSSSASAVLPSLHSSCCCSASSSLSASSPLSLSQSAAFSASPGPSQSVDSSSSERCLATSVSDSGLPAPAPQSLGNIASGESNGNAERSGKGSSAIGASAATVNCGERASRALTASAVPRECASPVRAGEIGKAKALSGSSAAVFNMRSNCMRSDPGEAETAVRRPVDDEKRCHGDTKQAKKNKNNRGIESRGCNAEDENAHAFLAAPSVRLQEHSTVLRVAQPGLELWTHYDIPDNFLVQISGYKRVFLFPPSTVNRLGIRESSSPIQGLVSGVADLSTYPDAGLALREASFVDLSPGSILFLPSRWIHGVFMFPAVADLCVNCQTYVKQLGSRPVAPSAYLRTDESWKGRRQTNAVSQTSCGEKGGTVAVQWGQRECGEAEEAEGSGAHTNRSRSKFGGMVENRKREDTGKTSDQHEAENGADENGVEKADACVSINVFFYDRTEPNVVYAKKDIYGNKDPPAYDNARAVLDEQLVPVLSSLPKTAAAFYLRKLSLELLRRAATLESATNPQSPSRG